MARARRSGEQLASDPSGYAQLRKSCESCRKRKIRCDSDAMPDGRCTVCISLKTACTRTYQLRVMKVNSGPKTKRVKELEKQLAVLEAKLNSADVASTSTLSPTSEFSIASHSDTSTNSLPLFPAEDLPEDELAERFQQFSFGSLKNRFFGSSSGYVLAKNAMSVKEAYLGRPIVTEFRRRESWFMQPWEVAHEEKPRYVFPERDLIASLVNLYFIYVHPTMPPILHRPSFEQSVAQGHHLHDQHFGALLLAVLAIASRYSDDPRVFVPGSNSSTSCGWQFFNQVQVIRKSLIQVASIYEVQLYCLISVYTLGTSSPQAAWLYVGLGMRFIQERGAHRRKREGHKITAEDELWKRAFWCLLSLERTVCAWLGRPSALHLEEYDVELPLEVDDEYWEHPDPEQAFKQPPGKPSLISYFICHIRLSEILGLTLRGMYASNKSRLLQGLVGDEWEQRVIAELDSAMDEFLASVPDHLRWDPNRPAGVFFDQSTALQAAYYGLQITIHRSYIRKPTILALPSLNKCTSAARSLIHVVDLWWHRTQRIILVHLNTSIFIAGVILLINLYGVKRAGLPIDVAKELAHVSAAMRILEFNETRFQAAGRLWDMLQQLNSWDGAPHPSKAKNGPKGQPTGPPSNSNTQEAIGRERERAMGAPPQKSSARTPDAGRDGSFLHPHSTHHPPQIQQPRGGLWIDGRSSTSNHISPDHDIKSQQTRMPDQWVEATAPYHGATSTGLPRTDQWSTNPMVDKTMAAWGTTPTTFANIADWDTYIGSMNVNAPGSGYDSDLRLAGLFPLPQQQGVEEGHFRVRD
ncbi:fungal-specific transcription factor domain-containing protein [Mycena galopus ATCC 62051]|nr:fungal-specific transcription factor domain-containing protein [Mycena galopus ATCC 62051]